MRECKGGVEEKQNRITVARVAELVDARDSGMGLLHGNVQVINWVNSGKPNLHMMERVIPSQAVEGSISFRNVGSAEGVETRG